jgi:hypothetical protein
VIVTAFNASRYLDGCLASIVASLHHELDVVVVDDGSTLMAPLRSSERGLVGRNGSGPCSPRTWAVVASLTGIPLAAVCFAAGGFTGGVTTTIAWPYIEPALVHEGCVTIEVGCNATRFVEGVHWRARHGGG